MTREEKQKAIDALKISAPVMAVTQEEFNDYIKTLNKVMDWLEQEQNTGHWTEHEHNGIAHIECSECSSWFLRSHLVRNSYCPNCGAKMSETEGKE